MKLSPGPARLVRAHELARAFYRDHLSHADGPRRYLSSRGVGVFTAGADRPWYLGYAPPGWTTLVDHLAATGYTDDELMAAGLATRSRTGRLVDLFRDRIMFPIHDPDGYPIGFIGRGAPGAGDDTPRYLNTPDTPIYHKGQILYGVGEQAEHLAAGAAPVLVEGPVDVLAVALAHTDGQRVGIAACGTSLTPQHADAIAALPGARRRAVIVALDNDDAGRAATVRAWELLAAHRGFDLTAATLPDGCDPADVLGRSHGAAALQAALCDTRPLARAVIDIRLDGLMARHPDLLRWPESRITAARTLAASIADLPPDQVLALSRHIADRTQTSLSTVADAVIDHLERPPPDETAAWAPAFPVLDRLPETSGDSRPHAIPVGDSATKRGGHDRSKRR
jgi:DNA primase